MIIKKLFEQIKQTKRQSTYKTLKSNCQRKTNFICFQKHDILEIFSVALVHVATI
jgi:hypothetical protein